MNKKLYRSRNDKVISGVCGGIAEYFGIDATIVRLLWALMFFTGGIGFLAYIVAIVVIPERPKGMAVDSIEEEEEEVYDDSYEEEDRPKKDGKHGFGIALIALGVIFILERYSWFSIWSLWPAIFILLGVYFVFGHKED